MAFGSEKLQLYSCMVFVTFRHPGPICDMGLELPCVHTYQAPIMSATGGDRAACATAASCSNRRKKSLSEMLNEKKKAQGGSTQHDQGTSSSGPSETSRNSAGKTSASKMDSSGTEMNQADVDAAWRALMNECVPREKHPALMAMYDEESDPSARYQMLLEFSSYLRQVSVSGAD